MLKRTIYLSLAGRLHIRNAQLVYTASVEDATETVHSFPVEDLGVVVLDSPHLSLTVPVLQHLRASNVAVVVCDATHMPTGLFLNLDGNSVQQEVFESQTKATEPLKKNLWKQTVEAKIRNQANLLERLGKPVGALPAMARSVRSGDPTNQEASAARAYWRQLLGDTGFSRDPEGPFPNNTLNYGYAILRAAVARALAGSGLLCTLGIHHRNRYNPFCLADDVMEPYRPFVDEAVYGIAQRTLPDQPTQLTREMKAELLGLLACDTEIADTRRPLMLAMSQTTASLARCFAGSQRTVDYPVLPRCHPSAP